MAGHQWNPARGGALCALCTLLAVFAHGAAPDAGVRAAWSALDAAWNDRDADRFSVLFTTGASFEFVDRGEALNSREAIRASFARRFPGFAPDLRHRTTVRDMHALADGVAAIDGTVDILRKGAYGEPDFTILKHYAIFAVMRRVEAQWNIELLRVYELPAEADGRLPPPRRDPAPPRTDSAQKSSLSR